MKAGTKTILFGTHNFLLHPLYVLRAWVKLYGWPKLHELVAIFIHDLGYWGQPNLDGEEGEMHPAIVADWCFWRGECGSEFWMKVGKEVIGHSGYYAAQYGVPISKLYAADKLFINYMPAWMYLLLGKLSGEIREYMQRCQDGGKYDFKRQTGSVTLWYFETRAFMTQKALQSEDVATAIRKVATG